MKKTLKIRDLLILVFLIVILASGLAVVGIVIYNVCTDGETALSLPDKKNVVNYNEDGLRLSSCQAVRSRSTTKAINGLKRLGNIAKEQADFGVTIVPRGSINLADNPANIYSGDRDDYTTNGYYDIQAKTIVITDREHSDDTLYHEMGHYVDYNQAGGEKISDSRTWQQITETEFCNTDWDMYFSRPVEFFAEAFSYYYIDPDWLHEKCPQAYIVINRVVEKYN